MPTSARKNWPHMLLVINALKQEVRRNLGGAVTV